jgi:hypothetical protein
MPSRSDRTTELDYCNQVFSLKTLIHDYYIASVELMAVIVVDFAVDHLREATTRRQSSVGDGAN